MSGASSTLGDSFPRSSKLRLSLTMKKRLFSIRSFVTASYSGLSPSTLTPKNERPDFRDLPHLSKVSKGLGGAPIKSPPPPTIRKSKLFRYIRLSQVNL